VVKSLIFPVHSRSMRWWSTGGSDNLQGEVLVGKHLTRELLDLVLQALTKEDFNEDFNEALDASGTAKALQSLSKPNEDDHPLLTKLRACNRMPHHLQISADGVRVHVVFHVLPEWSRRRCLWRECFPVKSVRRHPKLTRDQSRSLCSPMRRKRKRRMMIRRLQTPQQSSTQNRPCGLLTASPSRRLIPLLAFVAVVLVVLVALVLERRVRIIPCWIRTLTIAEP